LNTLSNKVISKVIEEIDMKLKGFSREQRKFDSAKETMVQFMNRLEEAINLIGHRFTLRKVKIHRQPYVGEKALPKKGKPWENFFCDFKIYFNFYEYSSSEEDSIVTLEAKKAVAEKFLAFMRIHDIFHGLRITVKNYNSGGEEFISVRLQVNEIKRSSNASKK